MFFPETDNVKDSDVDADDDNNDNAAAVDNGDYMQYSNCYDSSVVECPHCERKVAGLILGCAILKTYEILSVVSLLLEVDKKRAAKNEVLRVASSGRE